MKFNVIIILLVFVLFSCGHQKQLQKQFEGEPVTILKETYGEPKSVFEQEDRTIYVFEKVKELESTEISQGKLTLDEIITPKVNKTERYYFTVVDGIVVETRYEEEYER